MREFMPAVTIKAEPAAMRRWTKLADEQRLGRDGRLIPEEDWRIAHGKADEDTLDFFRRWGLEVML